MAFQNNAFEWQSFAVESSAVPTRTAEVYFGATVDAMLAGRAVRMARLVKFEFASQTIKLWEGFGRLTTNDAQVWEGIGELGTMSDPQLGPGLPTEQVTFGLSGLSPSLVAKMDDQTAEVKGRRVRIYLQAFDEDWQCLDNPYAVRAMVMDTMKRTIDYDKGVAAIELTAEPILSTKHFAPSGYFTDQDQQGRFEGDLGMERVALYAGKQTVTW